MLVDDIRSRDADFGGVSWKPIGPLLRSKLLRHIRMKREFQSVEPYPWVYSRRKTHSHEVNSTRHSYIVYCRRGELTREAAKRRKLSKQKREETKRRKLNTEEEEKNEQVLYYTPKVQRKLEVRIDKRTEEKWVALIKGLESESIKECNKVEGEWWDKERTLLYEQVKTFISSMEHMQGGRKFSQWKGSVLDSIGGAYLAQNVNDTLSSFVFMSLAAKYSHGAIGKDALDWETVMRAQVKEISDAIKKRGQGNNLGGRIKKCLNGLKEKQGNLDLEWLRDASPSKAREFLLGLPGMGIKSVECICLLTLIHKAFPIDRNAGRLAIRLGWVPLHPLSEGLEFHRLQEYPKENSVQKYLWPRLCELDHSILYELHCQMITAAKVFCTKRNPNCGACPMRENCTYYASVQASCCPRSFVKRNCTSSKCVAETESVSVLPSSSSRKSVDYLERDIEDYGTREQRVSKSWKVLSPQTKHNPKNLSTRHQVYELPDSHDVLVGVEDREQDDFCKYLLLTWTPDDLAGHEYMLEEATVYGTLLIPCRTAMRGMFPLNGTFFQVNEVMVDDESCEAPIKVPMASIQELNLKTLHCGSSMSVICKGLGTQEIQEVFREGYVCFRGFNRTTREPKPLSPKFHIAKKRVGSKMGRGKQQIGT